MFLFVAGNGSKTLTFELAIAKKGLKRLNFEKLRFSWSFLSSFPLCFKFPLVEPEAMKKVSRVTYRISTELKLKLNKKDSIKIVP